MSKILQDLAASLSKAHALKSHCCGQERVSQLEDDQRDRNRWVFAIMGKYHIQFWDVHAKWTFSLMSQNKHTRLHSFSLDLESYGFQLFVRWLLTPLKV